MSTGKIIIKNNKMADNVVRLARKHDQFIKPIYNGHKTSRFKYLLSKYLPIYAKYRKDLQKSTKILCILLNYYFSLTETPLLSVMDE